MSGRSFLFFNVSANRIAYYFPYQNLNLKDISMNSSKKITEQTPPPAYFASLEITDVNCFHGKQSIDLSDGNGKPAMWTVILGNNNTGKTTLLKCLADLEPITVVSVIDQVQKELHPRISTKGISFIQHIDSLSNGINRKIQCTWIGIDENWYFETTDPISNGAMLEYWSGHSRFPFGIISNAIIYGYGTSRKMGNTSLTETENQEDNTASLFHDNATLINAEEWLVQTDYASKNGIESAKFRLEKIKHLLTSGLLPDAKSFECRSTETNGKINNFVEIETDYGWVKLRELGYGYQVTLAWVVDLAKKMFERYPEKENPLHQPAIVLVDEIDLHLHPEWQRKIISFLSEQFRCTQFIVTTHSPLIVQSTENINLVLLKKEENHVVIEQPKLKTYKGWTVEEILSDLMGLDGKTLSDDYLKFMQQFDEALDEDDYKKAKNAYDELDKILYPASHQRKLLQIQMSSLMPE